MAISHASPSARQSKRIFAIQLARSPAPLALLLQRLEARTTRDDPVGARQDAGLQPGRTEAAPLVRPNNGNASTSDGGR